MADAFIGEIRIFSGNFAPKDWAFCNGSLLPIAQNTALYSILGTQYGGDGRTNFALPNLMGRAPMNQGSGAGLTPHRVGEAVGSATVTLSELQIPAHSHVPQAIDSVGALTVPNNNYWAQAPAAGRPPKQKALYTSAPNVQMAHTALSASGANQPHNNMQPYLAMNFIICLNGYYPSRD